ncbi:MAG: hypothetical protein PHO93_01385 [Candidatus Saccharimonadaceae bacterium]|nr:hypothetical protein [Candidatus Saccharimonadaceae bacterium]
MKVSLKKGLSYGTTSGVITSLGLLIGLFSSNSSSGVILAGLFTIAFADALSDGLGIHISEESEGRFSKKEIWEATVSTVVAKMALGLSFVLPIIFLPLLPAIITNISWGLIVLISLSYIIAKQNKEKVISVLSEHVGLAIFVVIGSFAIGKLINLYFV